MSIILMGKKVSVAPEEVVVRAWLDVMFRTTFFDDCKSLMCSLSKSKINCFCIDCKSPMCSLCCFVPHREHIYIKLIRHLQLYCIRLDDMNKFYNCGGIKTYSTGGGIKAVLLKTRISTGNYKPKNRPNVCFKCGITLEEPFNFCSIQCKVLATDRDKSVDTEKQIEGNGDPPLALSLPNAVVGDTRDDTGKHIEGNGDHPLALSLPNAAVDNHIECKVLATDGDKSVDTEKQIEGNGDPPLALPLSNAAVDNDSPNSSSRKRPRTEKSE